MKKLFSTLLSLAWLASNHNIFAQAPPIAWQNSIGGNKDDILYTLIQTDDGGFLYGGSSNSGPQGDKSAYNKGGFDYWLVKTDAGGTILWDKTIGGNKMDYVQCMVQTGDGGYIIGGTSLSTKSGDKSQGSKGNLDLWVVKTDAAGNIEWDKTFGGNKRDYATTIVQLTSGEYLLGGYSESGITGDKTQSSRGFYDFWLIKLNASGGKIWDKTIGGNNSDYLQEIIDLGDGKFILGGSSGSKTSGEKSMDSNGEIDYWLVKIDGSGNVLWDKSIGGSTTEYIYSVDQTTDGGFVLGGQSNSNASGNKTENSRGDYDFWAVKTDASGNVLWDVTLGGTSEDECYAMRQTGDGGYLMAGYSESDASGEKSESSRGEVDYWVVKLDAALNIEWDKTLGGSGEDELFDMIITDDGGCLLGGYSLSGTSGDKTENSNGGRDFWVIAYGPGTVEKNSETTAAGFSQNNLPSFTLFPNPGKGRFQIRLANQVEADIEVFITDMAGKEIYRRHFPAEEMNAQPEIVLENEWPAGVYLIAVVYAEAVVTQRLVIK
jgi:hypothetical protein